MSKSTVKLDNVVETFPILPLRDIVVFPFMVIPLFVGRDKSHNALKSAMAGDKKIILLSQKDMQIENPVKKDLYQVGVLANILQYLELPDGAVKVLVEGIKRVFIQNFHNKRQFLSADVIDYPGFNAFDAADEKIMILMGGIKSQFENYVKQNKKISPEVIVNINAIIDPVKFIDLVAAHLFIKVELKQEILEHNDILECLELLVLAIERELDFMNIEKKVRGRVKQQMEKSQREYYLNEQMKAIQLELGDSESSDFDALTKKVKDAKMSKEATDKALSELKKLKLMPPMSAESTVIRNYIDYITDLPWHQESKLKHGIVDAKSLLDDEHYGLEKVKERILEYLAVQERVKQVNGPILCLVGPPGVGKTSLGQSIAHATGREFVRMSLGGVRDEAEIRGHRRTYIGAMPGKILQKISKAGVKNPLFLLDEIDKMAMDFRGDPASALLEVLDPEQNSTFSDHYVEVDYDLSDVMFVATANTLDIPHALLDRMEIINLSGYTEDEKLNIANKYLLPKELKNNGLTEQELRLSDGVILDIIRYYTRESGVRSLGREISKVCRKVVHQILAEKKNKSVSVTRKNLEKYLGVRQFNFGVAENEDRVGQVTGLAWTEVGGELLELESAVMPGKGGSIYTGQLGDVMQESIQAAMTVVRSRSKVLGIPDDFFEKHDIHIHVPDGATPKDGPSAGIGMCTAIVSAVTGVAVDASVAMTGEITLRGEVLAIGGLKEKLLAAHRGGIKTVLIPHENVKDLVEIPDNIKSVLKIIPVRWIDEVFTHALKSYKELLLNASKGKSHLMVENSENKAVLSQ